MVDRYPPHDHSGRPLNNKNPYQQRWHGDKSVNVDPAVVADRVNLHFAGADVVTQLATRLPVEMKTIEIEGLRSELTAKLMETVRFLDEKLVADEKRDENTDQIVVDLCLKQFSVDCQNSKIVPDRQPTPARTQREETQGELCTDDPIRLRIEGLRRLTAQYMVATTGPKMAECCGPTRAVSEVSLFV
ncbi:hypothetical protein J6590_003990 [Homalodisca vitripennis]|nr:hypothetical protein J6590_003990 [Homalodisca vitripennis]